MLDKRILEQLFRRNYSEMIHLARVLLGDDGEAEDVVQDIFLRIADSDILRPEGLSVARIPPKNDSYLLIAVRNACLNRIRQMQLHEQVKNLLPIEDETDLQPIDRQLEQLEDISVFVDEQLEEPHRSIFHLRFDEDLTIAEIARRLGLNPNTAYKYLAQSIQRISNHYKHYKVIAMETTRENIRQLLEMLDNPEAYTEQEIQDIINRDEDTRETYRMMVEGKRSSRLRQADKPVDIDAAWQKFNQKNQPKQHGFGWMKIAASFVGVLLVSGIAFAAIQIVRYAQQHTPKTEEVINTPKPANVTPTDTLTTDTIATPQPIIYDNIPLEKMLPEIAAHYDAKVTFVNDKTRQLRFRFVWNPQKGIDQVVSDLNQFEHLTVTLKDNQITLE